MVQLGQQLLNALFLTSLYALFSVGYTLVFGVLDVLNLAHASVFMIGAVLSWFALDRLDWGTTPDVLVFVMILLGVFVACGVLGIILERVAFAPLRARRAGFLPPLVSSIAVSLILTALADAAFGVDPQNYPRNVLPTSRIIQPPPGATYQVLNFSWTQVGVLLAAGLLVIGLQLLVTRTRLGLSIRVVAENPRAARIVGINVDSVFMQTFFIASALGGVAGILFAMYSGGTVATNMGANVELLGLTAIIVGGLGSIPGALLGSLLIAFIQVFSVQFGFSNLSNAIVFGLLIATLVIRPSGLLGQQNVRRV